MAAVRPRRFPGGGEQGQHLDAQFSAAARSSAMLASKDGAAAKAGWMWKVALHNALCVAAMLTGLALGHGVRQELFLGESEASEILARQLGIRVRPRDSSLLRHQQVLPGPGSTGAGGAAAPGAMSSLDSTGQAARAGYLSGDAIGESLLASSADVCKWDLALHWKYLDAASMSQGGDQALGATATKSRVGRHGVLIRDSPHPDAAQLQQGYSLLAFLQELQQQCQGAVPRQQLIVITPTYARTFQKLHVLGLINSLHLARAPLLWVVVEAPAASDETRALLQGSGIPFVHLGADKRTPVPEDWDQREWMELGLRVKGLRFVREQKLLGRVLFADDSAVLSPPFFRAAQRVRFFGTLPVGIQVQQGYPQMLRGGDKRDKRKAGASAASAAAQAIGSAGLGLLGGAAAGSIDNHLASHTAESSLQPLEVAGPRQPVQAAICNEAGRVAGWHPVARNPDWVEECGGVPCYASRADEAQERRSLVWMGFVLNAELLWRDGSALWSHNSTAMSPAGSAGVSESADGSTARPFPPRIQWPHWVRVWAQWAEKLGPRPGDEAPWSAGEQAASAGDRRSLGPPSILDLMIADDSEVEMLAECSTVPYAWWQRLDARPDSKFLPRWHTDPQLDITVLSKSTPWVYRPQLDRSKQKQRSKPRRKQSRMDKDTRPIRAEAA